LIEQPQAHVIVKFDEKTAVGRGTSSDVVEASLKAHVNALNKAVSGQLVVDPSSSTRTTEAPSRRIA